MSFFAGMFRQSEEENRIEQLKKGFNTAKKLGVEQCQKCGFCCYRRTCIPTPNELEKIADFLDLTLKKTIEKYYCIDRGNFSSVYFVKPVGMNNRDLVGKFLPSERTFNEGKCIFLTKKNYCKIHDIKPESAISTGCWKPPISIEDGNYGWTEGFLENIIGDIIEY